MWCGDGAKRSEQKKTNSKGWGRVESEGTPVILYLTKACFGTQILVYPMTGLF